jgi:hypothetical protein
VVVVVVLGLILCSQDILPCHEEHDDELDSSTLYIHYDTYARTTPKKVYVNPSPVKDGVFQLEIVYKIQEVRESSSSSSIGFWL